MSKFGKFKDILAISSTFAKPFVPGSVGKVLDVVNGQLEKGGSSPASAEAIKQLGADNDDQTEAIIALHQRNEDQERRLKAIEKQLGL